MKIGIFLEKFTDAETEKDPGIIAMGLIGGGLEVTIFCSSCSSKVEEKFKTKKINRKQRNQISYWKSSGIQTLIIYSWLSLRYSKMIRVAKSAGLKIVLKMDSDGYLLYPHKPSYLKVFGLDNNLKAKFKHIIRVVQWNIFPKIISRNKINQIKLCDAVIIETPSAKENLDYSLSYWQEKHLSEKVKIIPNPIKIIKGKIENKKNIITCIGRWNDKRKNATALINVLSVLKTDWQINIIGKGSRNLSKKILENNPKILLKIYEKISHKEVFEKLIETKIFFSPSISESFNLAAAEALCSGCSVVGGPLPSFVYFNNNGKSGTLAKDFSMISFEKSLKTDTNKWDKNLYQPLEIASYWQKELNTEKISKQIIDLINIL